MISHRLMKVFWSDYKGTYYSLDDAPYNDMVLVKKVFEKLGFNVITVKNPTTREVVDSLIDGAAFASKCDLIGVYFVGHGCQMKDDNGDEADGLDELYVCRDGFLSDDVIKQCLDHYSIGDDKMLLMADICHSGGIYDGRINTYCASDEDKPSYQNRNNGIFTLSLHDYMMSANLSQSSSASEIRHELDTWYAQWKNGKCRSGPGLVERKDSIEIMP